VTSGVLGHITPGGRLAVLGYKAGEFTTLDLHQLIGRDLRVLPVNLQRTVFEPGAVGQALADVASAQWQPEYELLPADRVAEVLDRQAGRVLLDLTAGVAAETTERALEELRSAGVELSGKPVVA